MSYFIYILKCKDGTLYTGSTNDLEKRVVIHNEGKAAAKYTRARRPVKLVYSEKFETKSEALKREWVIKKMKRVEKQKLFK
jgi:putative endonuclease